MVTAAPTFAPKPTTAQPFFIASQKVTVGTYHSGDNLSNIEVCVSNGQTGIPSGGSMPDNQVTVWRDGQVLLGLTVAEARAMEETLKKLVGYRDNAPKTAKVGDTDTQVETDVEWFDRQGDALKLRHEDGILLNVKPAARLAIDEAERTKLAKLCAQAADVSDALPRAIPKD